MPPAIIAWRPRNCLTNVHANHIAADLQRTCPKGICSNWLKVNELRSFALSLLLFLGLSAQGALYTFSGPFTGGGVIPDNTIIGLTDAHTLTGLSPVIADVILTVNISGTA